MDKEEILSRFSEETKRKLAACKTPEEARRVLTEADEVATLDDEMMAAIAGGYYDFSGRYSQVPKTERKYYV